MMTGITVFAVLFQITVLVGIIIFAFKFLARMTDISDSQKSIAKSQEQIVSLLISKQNKSDI